MQTQASLPKATKVVGSGGRRRTVYVCDFGCWHSGMGQALKCKNAAFVARISNAVCLSCGGLGKCQCVTR